MQNYDQDGDRLSVILAGTVNSGDVDVVGTGLLGVALSDGVLNDTIEYAVEGVFRIPKASAAVIAQGEQVLYDASAGNVDDDAATPAAGDFLCGVAWEAAGNGVTTIAVKINTPVPAVT
jgi:predicted RecA/RadA family phage recombinase